MGLLKWIAQLGEKREEKRFPGSDIVAFYWDGTTPAGHKVKDISCGGAFLVTDERWYIGTLLMLTLQRGMETADPKTDAVVVIACQVVRHGADGVGVKFMLSSKEERKGVLQLVRNTTQKSNKRFRRRSAVGTSGQAIVEYALMAPLVFLLIVNAFNFCSFIYCWLTVADAARAAADYASEDTSTADAPATPNVAALTTMVQSATAGLPNYSTSNPTVTACEYNNGTTTTFLTTSACPTGVTVPPADAETIASGSTITYSTVAVDVTYTFSPILAGSVFMRFGLPALPTTIHRRTVVRWP